MPLSEAGATAESAGHPTRWKILDNAHREWKKECKLRKEGQKRVNELAGWEGLFTPPNEDNADEPDTDKET